MLGGVSLGWLEVMLFLNYKPVLRQPTGIGVYANAVLPAFEQFQHIMIPGGSAGGGKERLKRLAWSQFKLPSKAKEYEAQLIFTPAPEGYLGKQHIPQVIMVHDLRPLSHPEYSVQSLYFRTWVPPLLKQCRHILTNSHFTASEICRSIGIARSKVSVTPLGYDDSHFYPSDDIEAHHSRPYFLHVGQAYPHKNLRRVIESFSRVAQKFKDIELLLAGKPHEHEYRILQRLVVENQLEGRIKFMKYVKYESLPSLYRGAVALVYPSLWEGFGLPIIEAMACGVPVITSTGSATQEVAGESALLVDPYSVEEIADAMVQLLQSDTLRCESIRKGLMRSTHFSWKLCREATSLSIAEVLKSL